MAPFLVYALMEVGSLVDRLACRCSGAFVPLTANERILLLSDVAQGLAYEALVGQAPQLPAPAFGGACHSS